MPLLVPIVPRIQVAERRQMCQVVEVGGNWAVIEAYCPEIDNRFMHDMGVKHLEVCD